MVLVVAIEAWRSHRLKVVVDDDGGTVRLGSFAGAPVVVPAGEVAAVVLVGIQIWANTPGVRVDLVLHDGSTRITPLRSLRGEDEESELRAAAQELGELLGVPVRASISV